jgi:hypothetical protein
VTNFTPSALHLLDAAVDDVLFQFEVGDAVAQQAADAIVFLIDGDRVAGAAQLLRCRQSGWTAADNGDFLSGGLRGRLGLNPAFVPGALDDAAFNELDGNGGLIDAQHAGGFAGSGADAAGELGEVVGRVEAANGALPAAVVDQVVPVGDQVIDGAAGVAKGYTAIHATGALLALFFLGEWIVNFEPVHKAIFDLAPSGLFALDL